MINCCLWRVSCLHQSGVLESVVKDRISMMDRLMSLRNAGRCLFGGRLRCNLLLCEQREAGDRRVTEV